ncbi:MAG: tetratricopeptide repeat protein [Bacteroidia bacterium]|nr:tetratricopeptide repeat protein [Bacteroidia bacterium]MBT8311172.1 tetratricopeptide repeat protein [Bacteroidia bacterium]NND09933.1 tetratricopeptide repeat protein [Flavobacteriaceae bacterium]NNK29026.1 tetratricopeptide repeat protein [Flavobacteriaceae bacterium]NNL61190.1 tetratricopeptide repeat protein [Flavobacteriaceae bacterium]
MRWIIIIYLVCIGHTFGQSEEIAKDYFLRGEFEKALVSYEKLNEKNPRNRNYITKIVEIHQQLEQYNEAEEVLLVEINKFRQPILLVELGFNHSLKGEDLKAKEYYDQAMEILNENPSYAYGIAQSFERHSLLDQAIGVYERAMELNPKLNFNINLARIYGEQGNIEKMFDGYMNFIGQNRTYINNAKRSISGFISEDGQSDNNVLLRKILLKKIQSQPDILWNELLSWLFVQQRDYNKAFSQERAIYKRQKESLQRMVDLAIITINEDRRDVAKSILNYIIENSQNIEVILEAHEYLLDIETKTLESKDYYKIDDAYNDLFNEFGRYNQTLDLQIAYAHFLAFYMDNTEKATSFLKESLNLRLSKLEDGKVKLELGDILAFQEKFNEALIYYTQVQRNIKNSTLAQEARFKVAKTSYYKGDFDWAESQLKILKSSTSQLIANDALDLKLLISDNKFEDSSQTALKTYSKADLLAFQNRTDEAILKLDDLLENHKGETIEDQALLMQAKLYESKLQFDKAALNYQKIIVSYSDDILADDALFNLAEIYSKHLGQPEKAKPLYERIIFDHPDSIYFVEARKTFRALRGDAIN